MASVAERILEQYPQYRGLLRDPEVGPLLTRAVGDIGWSPQKFEAELAKTNWYKSRSAGHRQWELLVSLDPAEANQRRRTYATGLNTAASQLGVKLTSAELKWLTEVGLQRGLDPSSREAQNHIMQILRSDPRRETVGSVMTAMHQVNSVAWGQWLSPQAPKVVAQWGAMIALGDKTIDDWNTYLARYYAKKYPHLSEQFATGMSLRDAIDDNVNIYAQELETTPDNIFNKVIKNGWERQLIGIKDPGSNKMRMPTTSEAQKMARSTPSWWKTANARQQEAGLVTSLLEGFGKRA